MQTTLWRIVHGSVVVADYFEDENEALAWAEKDNLLVLVGGNANAPHAPRYELAPGYEIESYPYEDDEEPEPEQFDPYYARLNSGAAYVDWNNYTTAQKEKR